MNINYEYFAEPLTLENGEVLPELTVAYSTAGTLAPDKSNVIWVCHALTADSRVDEWWLHTVEQGRFLDPERWFVICANILGSHYGTTGPLSINPQTGRKWYGDFPQFTVRDIVACHRRLAQRLGIGQVELLIGSSIGGFQALEWVVQCPDFARKAAFIATTVRSDAWAIAFSESQRMAIEADASFGQHSDNAGEAGMAAARSIALLSYRGRPAYNLTQDEPVTDKLSGFRATTYQQHQGEKLRRRFNAYSYYRLSQAVDSHNLARGRGSIEEVLKGIKAKCLVVAITSDILFPPSAHEIMVRNIPDVEYRTIDSEFGHDGFLVEYELLDKIIKDFMQRPFYPCAKK